MKHTLLALCMALLASAMPACAQEAAPVPILPETLSWTSPPMEPKAQGAYMIGAEDRPGIYVFRVKLQKGGTIPPHRHPDVRHSTVLSGTLYVGFGEEIDESGLVAVPAGAVYTAPAGVPHYVIARDGDVVYEEIGVGPTGLTPVGGPGSP